jgi:hypothetical protein
VFSCAKGIERIRPEDHAVTQPMFEVQLVKQKSGHYEPKVLATFSAGNMKPPITPFPK